MDSSGTLGSLPVDKDPSMDPSGTLGSLPVDKDPSGHLCITQDPFGPI